MFGNKDKNIQCNNGECSIDSKDNNINKTTATCCSNSSTSNNDNNITNEQLIELSHEHFYLDESTEWKNVLASTDKIIFARLTAKW